MLHEVGRAGRDGALCPRCQSDGKQGDTWTSWRDAAADSKLPPGELSSAVLRLQLGLRSWGGTSPHDWGLWRGAEQTLAPAVGRKRGEEQREKRQASLQLPPVPTGCMAPGAWHVGEGRGGPTVPMRHPSQGEDAVPENSSGCFSFLPPAASRTRFVLFAESLS